MPDSLGDGLDEIAGFGNNPGNLQMFCRIPAGIARPCALVVVLHGCGQTAEGFVTDTGWRALADEMGFVLLAPQQKRENNSHTCFNWFLKGDITRNEGEAGSIRQMVEHARSLVKVDRRRIFVTGFSAGGAMANVMLATNPEIFEAGAIVAGLPYGATGNLSLAMQAMASGLPADAWTRGDLVRNASPFAQIHPRVSVWHGVDDTVVHPANAEEIIAQWRDVHGITGKPVADHEEHGVHHRAWGLRGGKPLVEARLLHATGHGVPTAGDPQGARSGSSTVDSTRQIAEFFGLADEPPKTDPVNLLLSAALRVTRRLVPGLAG